MHEKIKLARARVQFAKLLELCEKQRQEMREDPYPFINKASEEVYKIRDLLQNVKFVLYGYDKLHDQTDWNESMLSILEKRINKALKLINNYEDKKMIKELT